MASFLITGCSRGIGLLLVKQLSTLPSSIVGLIFATARGPLPGPALSEIIHASNNRVQFVSLDVTDQASIVSASNEVERRLGPDSGLDVLVNNAGIQLHESTPSQMKIDDLDLSFSINVKGVHRVTSTFLPLMFKGKEKKIVNISTTVGSISLSKQFAMSPTPSYKITKAALNMLTVQYSQELGPKGFTVFCVSPGWLKTDMGGSYADLEPSVGTAQVVKIIMEAEKKDNGSFRDIYVEGSDLYTGKNPPW